MGDFFAFLITVILLQGLCGSLLITSFELVIGELALHTTLVPQMWDYSNTLFNFDGAICLPFSFALFLLAIVAILVADAINYYVFEELPVPYYRLCGKIILRFPEKIVNYCSGREEMTT